MLKCTPADLDAVFGLSNGGLVELKLRLLFRYFLG